MSYLYGFSNIVVQIVFGLLIFFVLARFILQLVRADFYNPVSQFLVKITNPVLTPLRRIIPSIGKFDTSSLVAMLGLQALLLILILLLRGLPLSPGWILVNSITDLLELALNVFLFAILIQVVLSWINPGTYNPVTAVIYSLTEPVLRPCRQLIPPIGGMDLSPMVALIGIQLIKMLVLPPLRYLAGG